MYPINSYFFLLSLLFRNCIIFVFPLSLNRLILLTVTCLFLILPLLETTDIFFAQWHMEFLSIFQVYFTRCILYNWTVLFNIYPLHDLWLCCLEFPYLIFVLSDIDSETFFLSFLSPEVSVLHWWFLSYLVHIYSLHI